MYGSLTAVYGDGISRKSLGTIETEHIMQLTTTDSFSNGVSSESKALFYYHKDTYCVRFKTRSAKRNGVPTAREDALDCDSRA